MTAPNPSGGLISALARAGDAVAALTAAVCARTVAGEAEATPYQPDVQAMQTHIAALGQHFAAHFPGCMFEIRAIHPTRSVAVLARQYPCTTAGYAAAVQWAVARNRRGANLYISAAPRRSRLPSDRAASAADIVGAAFLVLDLDDVPNARAVIADLDPQPRFIVITGTEPCVRAQCWWPLREATLGMPAWCQQQRALAVRYGGDRSVCDAPRVMRLAGSVSYPSDRKLDRGYRTEVTTVVVNPDAPNVSAHQIARLLGEHGVLRSDERAEPDDAFADMVLPGRVPPEAEIRDLLSWIPPDIRRRDWIAVAGGLKAWSLSGGGDGLDFFIAWSRGDLRRDGPHAPSSFVDEDDCTTTWESLR